MVKELVIEKFCPVILHESIILIQFLDAKNIKKGQWNTPKTQFCSLLVYSINQVWVKYEISSQSLFTKSSFRCIFYKKKENQTWNFGLTNNGPIPIMSSSISCVTTTPMSSHNVLRQPWKGVEISVKSISWKNFRENDFTEK